MSEMDLHDVDDAGTEIADEAEPVEVGLDTPEADALEQAADVRAHGDPLAPHLPADVDPADRVDQERAVELDEDDYR